jgi:O-methyltransferase
MGWLAKNKAENVIPMPSNRNDSTDGSLAERYLDLLKASISFSLWPDPPIPAVTQTRRPWKQMLVRWLDRSVRPLGLLLCSQPVISEDQRLNGRVWRAYPDTLIGLKRLNNIQQCVDTVLRDGVPGDFIETGAWRGGACIFMRGMLEAHSVKDRCVFVADSFEGLPVPDVEKYPADRDDAHHLMKFLAVDIEAVRNNFRRYRLLDSQVVFLKGWFKDTLPSAPISKLAILRLDGDMYGSTMDAFTNLYDKLSPGGFCIIDDYALAGCKQAVDDFRARFHITEPLQEIDWTGRFWRKAGLPINTSSE